MILSGVPCRSSKTTDALYVNKNGPSSESENDDLDAFFCDLKKENSNFPFHFKTFLNANTQRLVIVIFYVYFSFFLVKKFL